MNPDAWLTVAIEAALDAGAFLTKGFGSCLDVKTKQTPHDFVTPYDQESERIIQRHIWDRFPDHSILGEEMGWQRKNPNAPLWIIDPLDGTTNFVRQIPCFCVSIAIQYDHETVCGVVYAPMTQELFWALEGQGSFRNGRRLKVSNTHDPKQSLSVVSSPHLVDAMFWKKEPGAKQREFGTCALNMAYVAAGRVDLFCLAGGKTWDVAAGDLLIRQAQGVVTTSQGAPFHIFDDSEFVAHNGHFHSLLNKKSI